MLQGHLRLRVTAPFPQRLLNLCAHRGLLFWGLSWEDSQEITLSVPAPALEEIQALAQQINAQIQVENRQGLPQFLGRFRHRLAFVLGFALSITTVCLLSNFILVIQVSGNETIQTAQIRNQLERAGLTLGSYGPGLDLSALAQESLLYLEGVSWISINLSGTRALVQIKEATPPPEIQDRSGLYDVVAQAGGIIEEIQAHQGQKLVEVGDTVAQGQVLIRGAVELPPPIYSQEPSQWLQVHSSGQIIARTWRTLTAVTPLEVAVKIPEEKEGQGLEFWAFGGRLTLWESDQLQEPGRSKVRETYAPQDLPLGLTHIRQIAYTKTQQELDLPACQAMLEEALLTQLHQEIGPEGQVLATDYTARVAEGLLYVTLIGECREEIGLEVPGTLPPEAQNPETQIQ